MIKKVEIFNVAYNCAKEYKLVGLFERRQLLLGLDSKRLKFLWTRTQLKHLNKGLRLEFSSV